MAIRAIYKNGVFKPLEDVPMKDGTEVDVYPRAEREKGKKPRSVRELGAYGMWAEMCGCRFAIKKRGPYEGLSINMGRLTGS